MAQQDSASSSKDDETYWSVDSAPRRFSEKVAPWRAPVVLLVFAVVAFVSLWLLNNLSVLNDNFRHNDIVFAPATGGHAIPVRVFLFSFFVAFGMCCDPRWHRKLTITADLVATYFMFCLALDLLLQLVFLGLGVVFSLHIVEIASGLIGFAIFSFKLLEHGEMPSRLALKIDSTQTRLIVARLLFVACVAGVFAWYIGSLNLPVETSLRNVSLLGGIGPGVFLFLPLFFILLYLGAVVEAKMARKSTFSPDLTVFVPAHNEEHIIADTIQAMDLAAAAYAGQVRLLVMNNASVDRTEQVAKSALSQCFALTGEVIDVPQPGKANALNKGLDMVQTDFCARVDADTQLHPQAFNRALRHFVDPAVGVVGGLPLPPGGGLFDRARFLEVAVKHGFYSVAFSVINSVVGIPGMFSVYRTEIPRTLGGFVAGMNGEDTDISLRAGESGYKLLVDPSVRYISEVPATYKHMREQRTRWFRSVFHISARCRDLIYAPQASIRGKVTLPYMLVNSARRAMMIPLVLFGVIEYFTVYDSFNILAWQSLVAVFIGAPAIMATLCACLLRRPLAVLFLPEYLVLRVLRAYFTLEAMLSISMSKKGCPLYSREALRTARPESSRIA